MDRVPGWDEHARPIGCPQMAWGRTLNKALKSYDLPTIFGQWSALAADRMVWQQRIVVRAPCPRPAATLIHDDWPEYSMAPHNASIYSFNNNKTSSDAYSWDELALKTLMHLSFM
jgi:hypothetical protein